VFFTIGQAVKVLFTSRSLFQDVLGDMYRHFSPSRSFWAERSALPSLNPVWVCFIYLEEIIEVEFQRDNIVVFIKSQ